MPIATSFKELHVWQNAMELAMDVFEISKPFPTDERFSLTDQIRRSSRSIAANISESWRKRRYVAAFISKLSDAETECAETQTWIELARRCGYLTAQQADALDKQCDLVLAQLVKMIEDAKSWCLPSRT